MAKNKAENDIEPNVDYVMMVKDGIEIEVHPTCVEAHQEAGWKIKVG